MMRNLVLLLYVYIFFLYRIFSQNNQLKTGYNVDVAPMMMRKKNEEIMQHLNLDDDGVE